VEDSWCSISTLRFAKVIALMIPVGECQHNELEEVFNGFHGYGLCIISTKLKQFDPGPIVFKGKVLVV
jgi:hypothetical protein